jgi:hypothetical protein
MMASTSRRPDIDGTTVRGGSQYGDDSFGDASKTIPKFIEKPSPRAAKLAANDVSASDATHLPFVDAEQYLDTKRPFCVRIDAARGGVIGALRELDAELLQVSTVFCILTCMLSRDPGRIRVYTLEEEARELDWSPGVAWRDRHLPSGCVAQDHHQGWPLPGCSLGELVGSRVHRLVQLYVPLNSFIASIADTFT